MTDAGGRGEKSSSNVTHDYVRYADDYATLALTGPIT